LFGRLLLFSSALVLSGCGEEQVSQVAQTQEAKGPRAPTRLSVEEQALEEFVYNPVGKRDPFRSIVASRETEEIRAPTPLQRFELEQYTLSGIIWGNERPKAMVEDPGSIGHVVELGTYIGRKWGKVTEIAEDHIIVTEEYLSMDGSLVVKPRVMALPGFADVSGSRW
jgi:type IV pilus assembly protein PilP